ncbi:unnamed protein product [Rotaria magnacalcarata]
MNPCGFCMAWIISGADTIASRTFCFCKFHIPAKYACQAPLIPASRIILGWDDWGWNDWGWNDWGWNDWGWNDWGWNDWGWNSPG